MEEIVVCRCPRAVWIGAWTVDGDPPCTVRDHYECPCGAKQWSVGPRPGAEEYPEVHGC
jgi:hypothetical protein